MSDPSISGSERKVHITLRGDLADQVLSESFKYGVKPEDYIRILLRWCWEERSAISDLRLSIQALTKAVLSLEERLKAVEETLRESRQSAENLERLYRALEELRLELSTLRGEVAKLAEAKRREKGGLLGFLKKLVG